MKNKLIKGIHHTSGWNEVVLFAATAVKQLDNGRFRRSRFEGEQILYTKGDKDYDEYFLRKRLFAETKSPTYHFIKR